MVNVGPNELQHFADVLLCKVFENLEVDLSLFDDDLWHKMEQMQTLGNESLQGEDMNLFNTRMILAPLEILNYKVDRLIGRVEPIPVYD